MLLKRCLAHVKGLEAQALFIWISIAGTLWAFFTLGSEIGEGDTGAFDRQLISLLRTSGNDGEPIGPAWFKDSMRDVTALGGFTFLALMTVLIVLGLLFHGKRREGIIVATTAISAQISIEILKVLYDRPRPDPVLPPIHAYTASFPSGHTTESTAIFLTIATVIASLEAEHNTKILAYTVATFVILSVGFSRVYLGLHWPTDVLGGWVLGTAWALAAWTALRKRPISLQSKSPRGPWEGCNGRFWRKADIGRTKAEWPILTQSGHSWAMKPFFPWERAQKGSLLTIME